jgi:hypothetical protein
MNILEIIWLEDVEEKCRQKHGVSADEVRDFFNENPRLKFVEKGERKGEDVYVARGCTSSGRYLIVFFILKPRGRMLILPARPMSERERRSYEKR